MKKTNVIAAVLFIALALGVSGCTLHLSMNPTSALDLGKKHIPCKIILLVDSDFQNYHWEGFSDAELQGLDYDLGSASKNLFVRAFTVASEGVTVVGAKPAFPVRGGSGIVLVVHPRIDKFSEKHNFFIRNADYYAEITYHVTVYDKTGKIVLENDYRAQGAEMGGIDLHRNYAAPAEIAMAQAVVSIIDAISKLGILQNSADQAR